MKQSRIYSDCTQVGKNLCTLRNNLGLTQEQLARHLSEHGLPVSRQQYAAWEEGRNEPNLGLLQVISNYYAVSIHELITTKIKSHALQIQTT